MRFLIMFVVWYGNLPDDLLDDDVIWVLEMSGCSEDGGTGD